MMVYESDRHISMQVQDQDIHQYWILYADLPV